MATWDVICITATCSTNDRCTTESQLKLQGLELMYITFNLSVRLLQITKYVSIANTYQFILFRII